MKDDYILRFSFSRGLQYSKLKTNKSFLKTELKSEQKLIEILSLIKFIVMVVRRI